MPSFFSFAGKFKGGLSRGVSQTTFGGRFRFATRDFGFKPRFSVFGYKNAFGVNSRFEFATADKWERELNRIERRALFRIGGLIRIIAKRSIRKRKGPSKPGNPPHSHVGLLRDKIKFSVDEIEKSVIVGPEFVPGASADAKPITRKTVPATLEFGGLELIRSRLVLGVRSPFTIFIDKRPYMRPALVKAWPIIKDEYADILRRGRVKLMRAA